MEYIYSFAFWIRREEKNRRQWRRQQEIRTRLDRSAVSICMNVDETEWEGWMRETPIEKPNKLNHWTKVNVIFVNFLFTILVCYYFMFFFLFFFVVQLLLLLLLLFVWLIFNGRVHSCLDESTFLKSRQHDPKVLLTIKCIIHINTQP